tara:strand:+ start:8490 stop:9272 length:783 start_codon:yes stop_codon:yes gene_type:complete
MFWSSKTLEERLPHLVSGYRKDLIGRANYTLSIGPEIYVTPTENPKNATDRTRTILAPEQGFWIPPGQFAFLLTEETVTVPPDALAFISVRATYKFRGLVNVSGFHVDPEFHGRLVFSVFNAGPSRISLRRGEECFHIWFASVDAASTKGPKPGYERLESDLIQPLGDQLQSFDGLDARIEKVEREQNGTRILAGIAIGVFGTAALGQCTQSKALPTPLQPTVVIQQPAPMSLPVPQIDSPPRSPDDSPVPGAVEKTAPQ